MRQEGEKDTVCYVFDHMVEAALYSTAEVLLNLPVSRYGYPRMTMAKDQIMFDVSIDTLVGINLATSIENLPVLALSLARISRTPAQYTEFSYSVQVSGADSSVSFFFHDCTSTDPVSSRLTTVFEYFEIFLCCHWQLSDDEKCCLSVRARFRLPT